jgi:site-specific recombinase XerD
LSVQKVVQLAKERQLKAMSAVTANAYLSAFATLMDFAVKEELIARNPATGLRLAGDGVRRKDKRLPFTVADLKRIFAAPLYTGCLDDEMVMPAPDRTGRAGAVSGFPSSRCSRACG